MAGNKKSTNKRRIELELEYIDKKRREVSDLENEYRSKMEQLTKILQETEEESDQDEEIYEETYSDEETGKSQKGNDGRENSK